MIRRRRFQPVRGGKAPAMVRLEQSILVEAPRPSVWFTLLRFGHYPAWMEDVREVRKTGESSLHWRATVAGEELEWEAELVAVHDDDLIEWHARDAGPSDVRITLTEVETNRTRVTMEDRFRPQGALAGSPSAAGAGRQRLRRDLERLKRQIEAPHVTARGTAQRVTRERPDSETEG